MNILSLNALLETLKEKLPINKVFIAENRKDRRIDEVIRLCRENKVVFQKVPQQTIARKAGENHQGIFAETSPIKFHRLEDILENINTGLILVLDGINDTGNLGAIIRSAVAANVDAVLIPQRHSAPINETVLKTSAGALLKAKIVQSKNLANHIRTLKENNFWITGTVMNKEKSIPYYKYDFTTPTAIIMGSEHKGTSPLLQKNSDQLIFIPHSPTVQSLNVSAATSIILFEALRQKAASGGHAAR
jgi:23S rRNA (guanosine2251-2'-O)-methyltransferase